MLLRAVFAILLAAICRVYAQEALTDALPAPPDATQQPIPESAWLDLRQNAPQNSKTQNAPVWVEALTLLPTETTEVAPGHPPSGGALTGLCPARGRGVPAAVRAQADQHPVFPGVQEGRQRGGEGTRHRGISASRGE